METPDQNSDLIQRAVAGDQEALGELLVQNHDKLQAYIQRKMPTKVQATVSVDDIIQQTYLSAFMSIERFTPQGAGSFLAWLRVIAHRKVMDAHRKKGKENLTDKQAHSPAGGSGDPNSSMRGLLSLVASDMQGPDTAAMVDELQGAFQVALAEMPENYRTVLELRYLQDLPNEEVAGRMGVSVGTVRGLCHRARQELRESLMRLSRYA